MATQMSRPIGVARTQQRVLAAQSGLESQGRNSSPYFVSLPVPRPTDQLRLSRFIAECSGDVSPSPANDRQRHRVNGVNGRLTPLTGSSGPLSLSHPRREPSELSWNQPGAFPAPCAKRGQEERCRHTCAAVASDPVDGPSTAPLGEDLLRDALQRFWGWLGPFLKNYFLLVAISSGVLLGLVWPTPGQFAQSTLKLTSFCTFAIFFVSGLVLDVSELQGVVAAWPAFLFGCVSSLLLTPWLGLLVTYLPIQPMELTSGLALFCTMPSTINVGISLARAADANVTLALAITVATNTAGILTVPFFLSLFLPSSSGLSMPVLPLLRGLIATLLMPLLAGMAVRASSPVLAKAVDKRKASLAMANNVLLSMVPWMQVSKSRATILQLQLQQILPVIAAGLAVHTVFLVFNITALGLLRRWGLSGTTRNVKEADAIDRSVILLASQKNAPRGSSRGAEAGDLIWDTSAPAAPVHTHTLPADFC